MDRRLCRLATAALFLGWSAGTASAQPPPKNLGAVSLRDRYSGPVTVRPRQTRPATARGGRERLAAEATVPPADALTLHYQVLSLTPGVRATPARAAAALAEGVTPVPLKLPGGYVLYELRGGKLTTIIDGQRQARRVNEFWLVRPGQNITFETEDDSVVLLTVQLPDS